MLRSSNFCHGGCPENNNRRFPTMWYVRQAKSQISLRIRAAWSEPLFVAWIFYECYATDWTSFGVSKLKRRLHRLVWVYTCQNATLLETTSHGSYVLVINVFHRGSTDLSLADGSNCFSRGVRTRISKVRKPIATCDFSGEGNLDPLSSSGSARGYKWNYPIFSTRTGIWGYYLLFSRTVVFKPTRKYKTDWYRLF